MTRMSGIVPKDRLLALAEVLLAVPPEALRQIDFGNMELGVFLKRYASPPEPAPLGSRSSIREDAVVREVARLLAETPDSIEVLDACCGAGTLAKRILRGIEPDSRRVSYLAIDRDSASIDSIKSEADAFKGFQRFRPLQREVSDLHDLPSGSIDLVVLNNVLHEIQPRLYPEMFSEFNRLLRQSIGRVAIVDMEELPDDSPEAIAITWRGSELEQILHTGGFAPELSLHEKSTRVYQLHVRPVDGSVDRNAMRTQITALLLGKVPMIAAARRQVEARLAGGGGDLRQWLVLTGTLARYADELLALGALS
jgi:ubiquinone/menaquinone biosynthesis C-methylase UbiE